MDEQLPMLGEGWGMGFTQSSDNVLELDRNDDCSTLKCDKLVNCTVYAI